MRLSTGFGLLGFGQAIAAVVALENASGTLSPARPQCWNGTNFPPRADWLSLERSWEIQHNTMLFAGDSSAELWAIKTAVLKYSAISGVPAELIFAVVMRESSGRVDTVCGDNGRSCGIMQVQGPQHYITCHKHPCSADVIDRMVKCGTVGACPGQTGSDLASCLSWYGGLYGAAARCYNTGSVSNAKDYTVARYGIKQYVQDIANILLGAQSQEWLRLEQQCSR